MSTSNWRRLNCGLIPRGVNVAPRGSCIILCAHTHTHTQQEGRSNRTLRLSPEDRINNERAGIFTVSVLFIRVKPAYALKCNVGIIIIIYLFFCSLCSLHLCWHTHTQTNKKQKMWQRTSPDFDFVDEKKKEKLSMSILVWFAQSRTGDVAVVVMQRDRRANLGAVWEESKRCYAPTA